MTHDSQIHRGARHPVTAEPTRQVSGPRRGGRGLRKPAVTALQEVVCTGLAPRDADAHPTKPQQKDNGARETPGNGRGEVPACLVDKETLCKAQLQIPPHSPWPGGGRELRSRGGRWPFCARSPGGLREHGGLGSKIGVSGAWRRRGWLPGVVSAEQKEAETLRAPELSHVILAAL